MDNEKILLDLGWKYFKEETSRRLLKRELGLGNFQIAQMGILGAIDRAFLDEEISFEEAREDYRLLNIDPELARRTRQETAKFRFRRSK